MKEIIRFKGLTLNRDEMGIEHGEMSLCGGVELHDGALRASVLDGTVLADEDPLVNGEDYHLVYVHHTAMYTAFITKHEEAGVINLFYSYEWYDDTIQKKRWQEATLAMRTGSSALGKIRSVSSVGNTLVVLSDCGLNYWLATPISDGGQPGVRYKHLGQQPPFLELQFNLRRSFLDTFFKTYSLPWNMDTLSDYGNVYNHQAGDSKYYIKDEYVGDITDMVMANVNYVTDQIAGAGCFYGPFMVRYAYRLYDGRSLIMHSPPVMMMPMLKRPVRTFANAINLMYVFAMMCELQVKRISDSALVTELKDWSDIVKSVDIFITPQQSRINTAGKVETMTVFDPDTDDYLTDDYSLIDGAMQDIVTEYKNLYIAHQFPINEANHLDVPEFEEKAFLSSVTNASTFFKLTSVNTEDIATVFTTSFADLKFDSYILRNITTQQQMPDDYKTHNLLLPATDDTGGMFVYNHRLNVYGISEKLFEGFSPDVLFPYSASGVSVSQVDTWVNTDSGLRRLSKEGSWTVLQWLLEQGYCFYPDSRAIRMGFFTTSFKLRRLDDCNELNGAFSFLPGTTTLDQLPTPIADDVVPLMNKIYTSRADNPFYFPNLPGESGINTIGTGEIIGAAAVTRALSTGSSVGDHDLAVFATDGIWVGKVSATGTYSNFHNISREVCINRDSICQLDQSVLFATNRSLSRFVEEDVVSITDVLDGPWFDVETKLASLKTYLTQQSLGDALRLVAFDTAPDVYYRDGKVFYDYLSSRIIVFRKDLSSASIALVFSIRDQAWSTMDVPPLRAVLNSYPTPYIQDTDGIVTRLDKPYDHESSTLHNGVIVTRTLSYSDTMDLIRGFRQMTDASHMPLLFFYGSNDQRTWQEIGRSARAFHNYIPGHPFRFFRVAIVMQMLTAERYQELELEVINKYAKL